MPHHINHQHKANTQKRKKRYFSSFCELAACCSAVGTGPSESGALPYSILYCSFSISKFLPQKKSKKTNRSGKHQATNQRKIPLTILSPRRHSGTSSLHSPHNPSLHQHLCHLSTPDLVQHLASLHSTLAPILAQSQCTLIVDVERTSRRHK